MIKIWHNSKCSKSREAKEILDNQNESFEIFEYLNDEFSKDDIKNIMSLLGISDIRDMLRSKEVEYKELDIDAHSKTQDEIIELVIKTPKLIERPIIIKDDKAVIARPMENLTELLNSKS